MHHVVAFTVDPQKLVMILKNLSEVIMTLTKNIDLILLSIGTLLEPEHDGTSDFCEENSLFFLGCLPFSLDCSYFRFFFFFFFFQSFLHCFYCTSEAKRICTNVHSTFISNPKDFHGFFAVHSAFTVAQKTFIAACWQGIAQLYFKLCFGLTGGLIFFFFFLLVFQLSHFELWMIAVRVTHSSFHVLSRYWARQLFNQRA